MIRPIADDTELLEVHRLAYQRYVSEGYAAPQPDRRLVHHADHDGIPQTTVLVAIRQQREVVGSISLTLDGPCGLTVEKDFKSICDLLRDAGLSLAVIWRMVTKGSASHSSRLVVDLLREAIHLAALQGSNTFLSAINPKHLSVHERLLNATAVSSASGTTGLDNAPSVLIRYDYERLPSKMKKLGIGGQNRRTA